MQDFQHRIEELMEEAKDRNHKCTRAEFARQCGITTGQLSGYLQGNGTSFCTTLARIAKNKNVSVSWLIGASDHRLGEVIPLKETLEELDAQELHAVELFAEFIRQNRGSVHRNKK